jgi:2-methylcitrate dehydratase PrpD
MRHPSYAPFVASSLGEAGTCTAIGSASAVPAATAALLNGGATTVLQWQDGHRLARGHPASHLVPVLLALAESRSFAGEQVMAAFVAGYEVGTRIGISLGGLQSALHDAGNWATIGAAAGAAHLMSGGDPEPVRQAIEGTAAIALFPYRETPMRGATIHHLYIGTGCAIALRVAAAVEAGLSAAEATLEDFFGPRAGSAFDPARLTAGIDHSGAWEEYLILTGYIKWHPICAHASGVADAMVLLMSRHDRLFDRVEQVSIGTYGYALQYDASDPANDLASRFSIKAIVAAKLLGKDLSAELLRSSPFLRLLDRIVVRHDPALDHLYPAGRPARVSVRLETGETDEAIVVHAYGDAGNLLSENSRRQKLHETLARGLGDVAAGRVPEAFDAYLAGAPIEELTRLLRTCRE